jgi:sugar fermentation stimulation protein A
MFPDAPTIRGQKHIKELIQLAKQGKKAEIWFLLTNDV